VSISALQNAAPETASGTTIFSSRNNNNFQPHVDGVTIPAQPWSIGPKVPMIFGSNSMEGALFVLGTYQSPNISAANYSSFLNTNFGPAAPIVEQQYPLNLSAFASTGFPAYAAMTTIITEALFHCPSYQALLKAEANNIPVYAFLNSHKPNCQWMLSLPAAAIPLVGATHTSELPYVFGHGVNLPLGEGNCSFTADEYAISESLISAYSAMASTGNPSVQGGIQWPQWKKNTSQGVNIVNTTGVSTLDYSQCAFWDMIDNSYLNFTTLTTNQTSGNASAGKAMPNGAEKGVKFEFWASLLVASAAISVLMR
jgi:carboxylesterase type B